MNIAVENPFIYLGIFNIIAALEKKPGFNLGGYSVFTWRSLLHLLGYHGIINSRYGRER